MEQYTHKQYHKHLLFKARLMKKANPDKISSAIAEQVALVGSRSLYETIHGNFKELKFEAFFAKEHFDLFRWRVKYFHKYFPEPTWFTLGGDDSHYLDTVEYQITQKFDEVMAVASSRRPAGSRKVYFDNDEITSSRARSLYEKRWIIDDFREEYFSNFTYSEALHIILAGFQCEPLSLKFAAMKKVLVLDLEVKDLPEVLQVSAEKGFFTRSDQILPFINEEGRKTLKKLKRKFGVTDEDDEEND